MQPPICKDQSPEKVAKRLRVAMDLHRTGVRMMWTKLCRDYPGESPEQLRRRLNDWLQDPRPNEQLLAQRRTA